MRLRLTDAAAACSRRAYPFMVQAYPREFRLEFGDDMIRAFGEKWLEWSRARGTNRSVGRLDRSWWFRPFDAGVRS